MTTNQTPESPAVTRARLVEAMEWANYQAQLVLTSTGWRQEHSDWKAESARLRHAIAVHDREQLEISEALADEGQRLFGGVCKQLKSGRKTKRTTKRKA